MKTQLRVLECLSDGRFHSGEALAGHLGLSRAAVWKATRGLSAQGIEIHAVRGRGYRLAEALELVDVDRVRAGLGPEAVGLLGRLETFLEIDSTNRYLMERGATGGAPGWVCLAESQRAGRGRRGRQWHSPPCSNLYLSLLWRYPTGPEVLTGLSLAVGVTVAQLLRDLEVEGVGLKWPNDLLCDGRKLGGVLLESSGESGSSCHVVVGLGLNVRMPASAGAAIDQPWCDLATLLGSRTPSRNTLASRLIDRLLPLLADYPERGLAPHLAAWHGFDGLVGQQVQLHLGDRVVDGRHRGIDRDGALLLESHGTVGRYHGGEVTLRGAG
jgi:BirA family biotin operon repressor/biotin-[acetyl-CoA-carboxylase] ligase